jgi:hypothetical protein
MHSYRAAIYDFNPVVLHFDVIDDAATTEQQQPHHPRKGLLSRLGLTDRSSAWF